MRLTWSVSLIKSRNTNFFNFPHLSLAFNFYNERGQGKTVSYVEFIDTAAGVTLR